MVAQGKADDYCIAATVRTRGFGVAKVRCGSCRFFEDAGIAGSGWCHHPQKQSASNLKIMVRKNELACRDEWSRSLFEPGRYVPEDPTQPTASPLPDALVSPGIPSQPGVDVLLGEARLANEAVPPWRTSPPSGIATRTSDNRVAIQRARESYRERSRAETRATRAAGFPFAARPEALREEENTLVGVDALASDHSASTSAQLDVFQFVSDDAIPVGWEKDWETELQAEAHESAESSSSKDDDALARPPVYIQAFAFSESSNAQPPVDEWTEALRSQFSSTPDPDVWLEGEAVAVATRFGQVGRETEAVEAAGPGEDVAVIDQRQGAAASDTVERLREAVASQGGPIDGIRIAEVPFPLAGSDVPQTCRTCRDFRPGEGRGVGWCANQWAFTHHQVVAADEPAACLSAIGSWWLPSDEFALALGDISAHGSPTPFLDRWLPSREGAEEAERKPS